MVKIKYRNNIKPQSEFNEKIELGELLSWIMMPILFVGFLAAGNVWREFMLAFLLISLSRHPCGGRCRNFVIFIMPVFISIFYLTEITSILG